MNGQDLWNGLGDELKYSIYINNFIKYFKYFWLVYERGKVVLGVFQLILYHWVDICIVKKLGLFICLDGA